MAMNLELPDKLDEKVEEQVSEGYYTSKSEAIRTALRKMLEPEDE